MRESLVSREIICSLCLLIIGKDYFLEKILKRINIEKTYFKESLVTYISVSYINLIPKKDEVNAPPPL